MFKSTFAAVLSALVLASCATTQSSSSGATTATGNDVYDPCAGLDPVAHESCLRSPPSTF
jgi:hypothetical protein